jgi:hypothetical protein
MDLEELFYILDMDGIEAVARYLDNAADSADQPSELSYQQWLELQNGATDTLNFIFALDRVRDDNGIEVHEHRFLRLLRSSYRR